MYVSRDDQIFFFVTDIDRHRILQPIKLQNGVEPSPNWYIQRTGFAPKTLRPLWKRWWKSYESQTIRKFTLRMHSTQYTTFNVSEKETKQQTCWHGWWKAMDASTQYKEHQAIKECWDLGNSLPLGRPQQVLLIPKGQLYVVMFV